MSSRRGSRARRGWRARDRPRARSAAEVNEEPVAEVARDVAAEAGDCRSGGFLVLRHDVQPESSCCESGVEPTRSQNRTSAVSAAPDRAGCRRRRSVVRGSLRMRRTCRRTSRSVAAPRHSSRTRASTAPHAPRRTAPGRLSWSQDGQRIADRLACGHYHDRLQTSERAAINGSGHSGRKWDGRGQRLPSLEQSGDGSSGLHWARVAVDLRQC